MNSTKCSSFPISNWDHSMTDHVLVVDEFWEILWLAHHFVYVLCSDETCSRMCICNCLAQQLWYLCWIWKIMIGFKWRLITMKFTSMSQFKSHIRQKNPVLNIFTNIFVLSAEMCYILNSYMNSSRSVAFLPSSEHLVQYFHIQKQGYGK